MKNFLKRYSCFPAQYPGNLYKFYTNIEAENYEIEKDKTLWVENLFVAVNLLINRIKLSFSLNDKTGQTPNKIALIDAPMTF